MSFILVSVTNIRNALDGVLNVQQPTDSLGTGGQPSPHHLEALAAAGCAVILDLRDVMEPRDFDEPEMVARLGMRYVNCPVHSGSMTDETLHCLLDEIRGLDGDSVFVHCVSGNRVGAALIAHLVLDLDYDEDAAVTAAFGMGLRSPDLLEWALDFTRRQAGTTTS